MPRFALDWFGGSSAVVDLVTETQNGLRRYMLRYTSPFRPTMRAPRQELPAGQYDLDQINNGLDVFASRLGGALRGGGAPPPTPTARDDSELADLGQQIFELVLPRHVRSDLRKKHLFIELGTDEGLLHFPWELMHDGEDFICLKHFVGRYVNLLRTPEANGRTLPEPGSDLGELRMLVIGVPSPRPQGDRVFAPLPAVQREIETIVTTLARIGVEPAYLAGPDATRKNVLRALRSQYHLIHFSGHAAFDPADPQRSALVLDDADISVGALTSALAEQRSVLCVVNACETTRSGGATTDDDSIADPLSWRDQYNIYGLARAFLENGAYLLGSRWKLPDESAQRFTEAFYTSLLGQGAPIGSAITTAREAVRRSAAADDFSWASYVYYGDPRMCFKRTVDEPAEAAEEPSPLLAVGPEPEVAETVDILEELARSYEAVREAKPASSERTVELSKLVSQVAAVAGDVVVSKVVPRLTELGEGDRIVSLGLLEAQPDPNHFDFVQKVIERPATPFEEYHGLKAAARMLPDLSPEQTEALADVVSRRAQDPDFFGTDRYLLASQILGRIGGEGGPRDPDFE
jgi:CHAT domain